MPEKYYYSASAAPELLNKIAASRELSVEQRVNVQTLEQDLRCLDTICAVTFNKVVNESSTLTPTKRATLASDIINNLTKFTSYKFSNHTIHKYQTIVKMQVEASLQKMLAPPVTDELPLATLATKHHALHYQKLVSHTHSLTPLFYRYKRQEYQFAGLCYGWFQSWCKQRLRQEEATTIATVIKRQMSESSISCSNEQLNHNYYSIYSQTKKNLLIEKSVADLVDWLHKQFKNCTIAGIYNITLYANKNAHTIGYRYEGKEHELFDSSFGLVIFLELTDCLNFLEERLRWGAEKWQESFVTLNATFLHDLTLSDEKQEKVSARCGC